MSKDKEVKLYHSDVAEEYITITRWDIDICVEFSYVEEYDKQPNSITFPALDREQFEELVKATRYVMGWE